MNTRNRVLMAYTYMCIHTYTHTLSPSHRHVCILYKDMYLYVHISTNGIQFVPGTDTFKCFFCWYVLKKTGFLNSKTIVNALKLKDKLQAKRCMCSKKLLLTRPYLPEGKYSHVQRRNREDNVFQFWALLMYLPYTHNKDFWIKLTAFFLPE